MTAEPSLEELLVRYRDSDPAAFKAFYRRTKNLVFHFLLKHSANRADAEDVFQETYFRVHRYVSSYDPGRSGVIWLLSIARRAMIDRYHATKKAPLLDEAAVHAAFASPDAAAAFHALLAEACATLTPDEVDLVYRRLVREDSFAEIAAVKGVAPATLRQRLSRLMLRLRKIYE